MFLLCKISFYSYGNKRTTCGARWGKHTPACEKISSLAFFSFSLHSVHPKANGVVGAASCVLSSPDYTLCA